MSPQTAVSIYTLDFSDITHEDVGRVGGKNASLGEMFHAVKPEGVGVLDGSPRPPTRIALYLVPRIFATS